MTCPNLFDLAVIAENYGQLNGILAGFAFTALVLLMTPTQASERFTRSQNDGGAPLALFSAFVALILSTLLYAVLAGDTSPEAQARTATAELIDGLVMSLAVISLMQGLYLLMRTANIDESTVRTARVVAVVIFPVVSLYFVAQGASDSVALRTAAPGRACVAEIPPLGIWLTLASAGLLIVSLTPWATRLMAAYGAASRHAGPAVVITASVLGAMTSGEISTHSPDFLMSAFFQDAFLTLSALLITATGLLFSAAGIATTEKNRDRRTDARAPAVLQETERPEASAIHTESNPTPY